MQTAIEAAIVSRREQHLESGARVTYVSTRRNGEEWGDMIEGLPSEVEVITLFVDDVASSKAFYAKVFGAQTVWQDEVSSVLKFGGLLINLLDASQAPPLVEPMPVGSSSGGARALLTIRVIDVDAVCAALREIGVDLLNGPIDRPWGRRTAAFADPSGHVWEIAEVIARK